MYREVVRLKPIIHQVIHFSASIRAWEIANDTRIEMGSMYQKRMAVMQSETTSTSAIICLSRI
ncbi:hypothetical protein [Paenibacillus sp.]|uniref:hypothetical protein n=1 Tax=Paenibacillus sp. TaxID=58172 RepID=UPI0034646FF2